MAFNGIPNMQQAEVTTRSTWEDPNEVRVANWMAEWDGEAIDAGVAGVPMARAAIKQVGTNYAPSAVRQTGFFYTTYNVDYDVDIQDLVVRDLGDMIIPLTDVHAALDNIREAATALFSHEPRFVPVFIGGEHSILRPLVQGLHAGREDVERIGIVHFDAHLDAQVLDFAGPHNGTPLRGLLGDRIGLEGRNVASIGIAGFANAAFYRDYVREQGTTVFTSRDVARGNIDEIIAEAYRVAADGTDAVYVTFDIDCMDVAHAPGTGASASGGLTPWQALDCLHYLGQQEKVAALEMSEIDPMRDVESVTSRLGMKLILAFLAGLTKRQGRAGRAEAVAETGSPN